MRKSASSYPLIVHTCTQQGWYKVRAHTPGFQFSLLPNDAFGASVAGLGDVDGDGVPDMAVGAYLDRDFQAGGGAVYVLLLQRMGVPVRGAVTELSPVRAAVKIGPGQRGFGDMSLQSNAYFGASVAVLKVRRRDNWINYGPWRRLSDRIRNPLTSRCSPATTHILTYTRPC